MLTGTNLTLTKEYNLRIIHETIRLFGPLSRAEVARRTELTPQTVSNLVRELIQMNLVIEADKHQAGRGAPSVRLEVNPAGAFSIGLDLDRDHLTGVLVDLTGAVRQRIRHDLSFPTPDEALKLMTETVQQLVWKEGLTKNQVCGVGVGVPGPMYLADDGKTYLVNPLDFGDWHSIPLSDLLEEQLGIPVVLENNATAAAVGERWYGAGRHMTSFFYFYCGSGLGGGLIINGQPFEGQTGNAGEVGYLPIGEVAKDPPSPARPHAGQHFNLPRLYRKLREEGLDVSSPDDLRKLFLVGNPSLLKWMDTAASMIASMALAVEYLIDPTAIFFGGRLADEILEDLMKRVREQMPDRRLDNKARVPEYRVATAGLDAAAMGVATLPIYDLFAPTHQALNKQADSPAPRTFASTLQSGNAG